MCQAPTMMALNASARLRVRAGATCSRRSPDRYEATMERGRGFEANVGSGSRPVVDRRALSAWRSCTSTTSTVHRRPGRTRARQAVCSSIVIEQDIPAVWTSGQNAAGRHRADRRSRATFRPATAVTDPSVIIRQGRQVATWRQGQVLVRRHVRRPGRRRADPPFADRLCGSTGSRPHVERLASTR